MARIRRLKIVERPIYFVTTNTHQRKRWFLDGRNAIITLKNIHQLEERGDVENIAFVIMPDHLHLLFEIVTKKTTSEIMHDVKSHIAHEMSLIQHRQGCHALSESNSATRSVAASGMERKYLRIWQRSFYDHVIRDERDLHDHIRYIQYNPVKHGYVKDAREWPWLSIARQYSS